MNAVRFHISCETKLRNDITYALQTCAHQTCRQNFILLFFSVTDICTWIAIFRLHANTACRRRCSISGAHQHKTASYRKDLFQSTLSAWECMKSFLMKYRNKVKENMNLFENTQQGSFLRPRQRMELTPQLSLIREKIVLVLFGRIVSS